MENKHRSEKLDALLNQKVTIFFKDGTTEQGVLFWNDVVLSPPFYLHRQGYYLQQPSCCLYFLKSHVKKIEIYVRHRDEGDA